MKEFLGIDCVEISCGYFSILASQSVGPRILSLSYKGSENLFAELPGEGLDHPGGEKFYFYGGHRFWLGPENPSITYLPDSKPINIKHSNNSWELIQEADDITGVAKYIQIKPTEVDDVIIVDHILYNSSDMPVNYAPWAITQLKLGGQVIIPQQIRENHKNILLPDRLITLWPYSDIHDPRVTWGNQFIFIDTGPIDNAIKIGVMNDEKWMAYFIKGLLFIKYADYYQLEHLIDKGASSECYCNSKFVELETLGPLTTLRPLESLQHREVWRIVEKPFERLNAESMLDFISQDNLTNFCLDLLA